MNLYKLIRPLLFTLDPETAHKVTMSLTCVTKIQPVKSLISSLFYFEDPRLNVDLFGLTFRNPLGFAAGIDKSCTALELLSCLGPGAIEVGVVSAKPQLGNERPRIFRFPEQRAIINRMGNPNIGADAAALNLKATRKLNLKLPHIGLNIGKTTATPLEEATADCVYTLKTLYDYVDYFIINVSCPNVKDYSKLQEKEHLLELLMGLQEANVRNKPLLVKLAPDLSEIEVDDALECCLDTKLKHKIAGIIATNTTLTRDGLPLSAPSTGGMSGKPLFEKSLTMISSLSKKLTGKLPIVGVGGVSSAEDVITMLKAGASLVEFYTALVYEGPGLVKKIKQDLIKIMDQDGVKKITEYC